MRTLTALGDGARRYVMNEFSSLGSNLVIVLPGRSQTGGFNPGNAITNTPRDLTIDDAQALLSRLRLVRVVPDTCLYRSLARYSILRRAGHPARFVMGLRPSAPEILGHAWVELDGIPVGEAVDPELVVTFAYPDRAPPPVPR